MPVAENGTHADTNYGAATNPTGPVAALRVLASGSTGNSSLIIFREGGRRRVCVVDLGLSPRALTGTLGAMGLSLGDVEHVFITHFDSDHFRPQWANRLPAATSVHIHARHTAQACRAGLNRRAVLAISNESRVGEVGVAATLAAHDDTGVAVFRFEHRGVGIGYATDVGRPTDTLVDFLADVDVLAVESNYCPTLQAASARPGFLKRRVMGGAGHLSNEQSAALARRVRPRSDVVLLHLSRECNRPDLAESAHAGSGFRVTVSSHDRPTPWVTASAREPKVRESEPEARMTGPEHLFAG